MKRSLYARLAAMMFLQYVVNGSVLPIFSHYLLNSLHFEPHRIGIIMGMPALAALFAPAIAGQVADRYLSAERLLGACHAAAGAVMWYLSYQDGFGPFLWLYALYSLLFVPTLALTNTVAFHHVPDAKKDFAKVRLWGTVGWVAIAWMFGLLWLRGGVSADRLADALRVSALASFALAAYSLTLPRSTAGPPPPFAPWKAIGMFMRPGPLALCVAMFLSSMSVQFYYFGMAPYLSAIGVDNRALMPLMSIGQVSEVAMMMLVAPFLARAGVKWVLVTGAFVQTLRFVLFAFAPMLPVTLLGIGGHGFYVAFFFITAFIYVDMESGPAERARAQQLFNIIVFGIGSLAGFWAAGAVAQAMTLHGTNQVDYHRFWMVAAVLALGATVVLSAFFREPKAAPVVAKRPEPV